MNEAMLIINVGLLIVTAGAAAIAWWQAIEAGRSKAEAKSSAVAALAAQASAAEALVEANEIARDASSTEKARVARENERHYVEWEPAWDWERAKWFLANRGPDVASNARLTATTSTLGMVTFTEESVDVGHGFVIEVPIYVGTGGVPTVSWRVEWDTPLHAQREDRGRWPE